MNDTSRGQGQGFLGFARSIWMSEKDRRISAISPVRQRDLSRMTLTGQSYRSGHYANASDYVRHLIRGDQERMVKITHMQALVSEGLASGAGRRSMAALKKAGRARAAAGKRRA